MKPLKLPSWGKDRLDKRDIPIFSADPATYLVAMNIINRVRESASELKAMLSEIKPEFAVVVESVLARMSEAGLIEVINDRIVLMRRDPYIDIKRLDHFEFLPKVMNIVAWRIFKDFVSSGKAVDDEIATRGFPDHPKVRRRILQITDRYLADLDQLEAEVQEDPTLTSERVRFCMVMTGKLEPEDFE